MTAVPNAVSGSTTPPTARTSRRSSNGRCGSTMPRSSGCASAPAAWSSPGWQPVSTCWPAGSSAAGCGPPTCRAGADALAAGLTAMDRSGYVDPGFPMDSAWRGALPPDTGFVHLDDVPARVVLDLAQRGVALAKEHSSAHGPPASLLDQEVRRRQLRRRPASASRCGAYSP